MNRKRIALDMKNFDAGVRDYKSNWALVRETLYKLCKDHSAHTHRPSVNAKVLLIGRSFASGIERQINASGEAGDAISRVATHLYENRREVDHILTNLSPMREPLTDEKLGTILDCHKRLCDMLSKITRNTSPRSFVSKYLHFHCPLVPIFDSYAYKSVWRWCRAHADPEIRNCYKSPYARFPFKRRRFDGDYYCFALCFLQVYEAIKAHRPNDVTVTAVDVALGWLSE